MRKLVMLSIAFLFAVSLVFGQNEKLLKERIDEVKNGKELNAFYDFNSDLIGTTQEVTFADLPPRGQKDIEKEYKDYEIQKVVFYNDNEPVETNMFLYEEEFEH